MVVAVVDTGVLIGRADADDEHHDVAEEIVRGIDHDELPTGRVTNYVILETLNWIHLIRGGGPTLNERRASGSGGSTSESGGEEADTVLTGHQIGTC